jgi:transposase-like protein
MADSSLEPLVLTGDERRTLENWVKRRSTAQGLALRAQIVQACAAGGSNVAVAVRLGIDRKTVGRWRARFLRDRLDGLSDEPRPGVPRTITNPLAAHGAAGHLDSSPRAEGSQGKAGR